MDDNYQINKGHRQRLRTRFEKNGSDAFAQHELIELLLTYSIPVKDVKPLAKKLLKHFGSLTGILDADISELAKIEGMGPASAILIALIKELKIEYHKEKLKNLEVLPTSDEVNLFVKSKLAGKRDEQFMVIYLNGKNRILDFEINAEGTVDQAAVYPRKIIRKALENNASGLILAHNHPTGEPEPSKGDIDLTNSLKNICETMNIRILDHVVVGKLGYFSFHRSGLL